MKIAVPQLNYKTGDIDGNAQKIIKAIQQAITQKSDLIVFPQLAICGALPYDWLEREDFINKCRLAVEQIALQSQGIAVIIGAPNLDSQKGIMYNSAYFIQNGEVTDGVHKNILSDYDIFNESRYFIAGEDNTPIRFRNQNIRILFDEYEAEFIEKNDSLILLLNLTPFSSEPSRQTDIVTSIAKNSHKNVIAVNHVGSYTSTLFDGKSCFCNYKGQIVCQLNEFSEDFRIIDTNTLSTSGAPMTFDNNRIATIHKALCFGIKDYFNKNGFKKAILGLSGGIDSAVVATLATEALGSENVMGLLMPSQYSTDHSISDAEQLAQNLNIPHFTLPIKDIYEQYLTQLRPLFENQPFNVAEENIQARIRGSLVMAMSNKFGYIALNTSNKSEASVGYGTLYGDLCGSLSVIGDLYKTEVYQLAEYINRNNEIIPRNTITKAPSAELRPNQKDQDSLPDYEKLDAILKLYIEENLCEQDIIRQGYDETTVRKIINMVIHNEYKRAQCPPIIRVSSKSFGYGRKYPF